METLSQTDSCTSVFIAPLFTITKTWKQLRFLGADEWINKKWHMCVYIDINTQKMEYYSALFSLNNELKKQNLEQKGMGWEKLQKCVGSGCSQSYGEREGQNNLMGLRYHHDPSAKFTTR